MEKSQVEVRSLPQDQAERRLAWREGLVDFDGEPLNQAVDEINRHNHRHIIVDDSDLAARPVVGLFRANDPDGFALTVSIALGAQSVTQADVDSLATAIQSVKFIPNRVGGTYSPRPSPLQYTPPVCARERVNDCGCQGTVTCD